MNCRENPPRLDLGLLRLWVVVSCIVACLEPLNAQQLFRGAHRVPLLREATFLVAPDLDSDGSPDIAMTDVTGQVTILPNRGQGRYESKHYAVGLSPLSIDTGDLDGDELIDLLVVNSPAALRRSSSLRAARI